MAEKVLALFSSDSRELYKADAYRVLALPTGYCLQLRYRRKHIHGGVLKKIGDLVGQKGVVFFVAGNDVSKPENERNITLTSLREFEVVSVREDVIIETFNFYIKLGEFVDATPHPQTVQELPALQAFVSELEIERGPNGGWRHRVIAVAPHFPELTFFLDQRDLSGAKARRNLIQRGTLSSEFLLDEEARYVCRLTVHDPYKPPHRDFGLQQQPRCTTERAGQSSTRGATIRSHSRSKHKPCSSGRSPAHPICGIDAVSPNRKPGGWNSGGVFGEATAKAALFGVLMAAAAAGVAIAKIGTDKLATSPSSWLHWVLAISGGIAIGVCAGWLYEFFNKK